MKKIELKYTFIWFLFLIVMLSMTSCGSAKLPTTNTIEKNNTVQNDSVNTSTNVTIRPEVEIDIKKEVPEIKTGEKKCDSICNDKVEKLLNSYNQKVKQGKSELSIQYDKNKKLLTLYGKLQSSYDSIVKTSSSKKKIYYITKTITITKTTNELTKEQKFNVWVGRCFWLLLLIFIIYKIKK